MIQAILDHIFIEPIPIDWIAFTFVGGFPEILWIVLLASVIQFAFLAYAWLDNRQNALVIEDEKMPMTIKGVIKG
jgi:hypothetical protein